MHDSSSEAVVVTEQGSATQKKHVRRTSGRFLSRKHGTRIDTRNASGLVVPDGSDKTFDIQVATVRPGEAVPRSLEKC